MKKFSVHYVFPFGILTGQNYNEFSSYEEAKIYQLKLKIKHFRNKLKSLSKKEQPKVRKKIKKYDNLISELKERHPELFI